MASSTADRFSPEWEKEVYSSLATVCAKYELSIYPDTDDFRDIPETVSLDVEHDEHGKLVLIGVSDGENCWYWTTITPQLADALLARSFITHNGKTDLELLRFWGIPVKNSQLYWDTELTAHVLDSSRKQYGLKTLAKSDLGIEYLSYDDLVGKRTAKARRTLDHWPINIVAMYNALDCFATYQLSINQKGFIRKEERQYLMDIEQPCAWVFQTMENRGCLIDVKYLKSLETELERQKKPIYEEIINELGPINLNSPKQLLGALNEKGIYPTLKGKPSTDKRAIESYRNAPVVNSLLRFSELETLLTSFVKPYLERKTEVVNPFFNQCGTRTGRPSCSNPNLLQIPRRTENGKKVRRMFIARPGFLLGDCDYGQIEPRVLAHLSKDPQLCEMFNDQVDFHTYTAERLGIDRSKAKILNLSVGYRATFKSVGAQLQCDKNEAQKHIEEWWAMFPKLRRWQEELIFNSKKSGFVETLFGRRIQVEGLNDFSPWKREHAERQLINNITQASAAEIMKYAMIKVDNLRPSVGLLAQIYDELLFEIPEPFAQEDFQKVKADMETAVVLDVPLIVDGGLGSNWAECKGD